MAGIKFVRDGVTFEVKYVQERVWDSILIYSYHPERLIFKRKFEGDYIFCVAAAIAKQEINIDTASEDYFVKLAEFVLDSMLKNRKNREEKEKLHQKQLEYMEKMSH